jgi:hypothetical protein
MTNVLVSKLVLDQEYHPALPIWRNTNYLEPTRPSSDGFRRSKHAKCHTSLKNPFRPFARGSSPPQVRDANPVFGDHKPDRAVNLTHSLEVGIIELSSVQSSGLPQERQETARLVAISQT